MDGGSRDALRLDETFPSVLPRKGVPHSRKDPPYFLTTFCVIGTGRRFSGKSSVKDLPI